MGAIESFLHFDLIHVDHRPHTSPKLLQLLIVEDACSLRVCVFMCVLGIILVHFQDNEKRRSFWVQQLNYAVQHVATVSLDCVFTSAFGIYWESISGCKQRKALFSGSFKLNRSARHSLTRC